VTRIPGALDRKGASSDDQCEYENLSHIFELPRVLYHGTSIARLRRILSEGRLAVSATGPDRKVSLTTEVSVAEYFACHAVLGDRRSGVVSKPIVLLIDGEGLLELNYELTAFSDPIWGDGRCDWENEIACWTDIKPSAGTCHSCHPDHHARLKCWGQCRTLWRDWRTNSWSSMSVVVRCLKCDRCADMRVVN